MGTEYYELKKPLTSLVCQDIGGHIHLTIFMNHGSTGTLILRKGEELSDFLNLLKGECVAKTSYLGDIKGKVLKLMKSFDSENVQLLSSNDESITLKELKKLCH
jgi:hypothetical protein